MDNFKGYKRQTIKIGEGINIPPFRVISYNMKLQLVEIHFTTLNAQMMVPFNFGPLEISPYGQHGYMSPEHLPFKHPGFIMGKKSGNIVSHRSSNEEKQLLLDRDFHLNGGFALAPLSGSDADVLYYTSSRWEPRSLKEYLDSLKEKSISGKGTVYALMDENSKTFNQSILLSKINKDRYVVFVLFENEVVYPFKITILV